MDLDIHLDRGDTLVCTSHLEVHIAEEVLQPLDIRQHDIIVVRLAGHQTAGNTCNGRLDRHTCRHQRHRGCTDARLGGGTV